MIYHGLHFYLLGIIFNFAAMLKVHSFTFNPFQENTYIVYNDEKSCIIFDPGMYTASEEKLLMDFISSNGLKPQMLINTHCHIDHIFGNAWCAAQYKLPLQIHRMEQVILERGSLMAATYGLNYSESVKASVFLEENQEIRLGNDTLKLLFTPGHSPGSLSFYSQADHFVIAGDALFYESIGRTDLPGGDHATLIHAIKTQLLTLPEDTIVYSGHGPATDIGHEKAYNPFLK
jgi:hydroxyacylglutathione hydrolase